MKCVSEVVLFQTVCQLLERIVDKENDHDKCVELTVFYLAYKSQGREFLDTYPNLNVSVYPAMRLLLPECDNVYKTMSITERDISIMMAGLDENMPSSYRRYMLGDWKPLGTSDDVAEAAERICRDYCAISYPRITVYEVNIYLTKLAEARSREAQKEILEELLLRIYPEELKWIIRIVLKKLQINLGERQVMVLFHRDAHALYLHNQNLQATCHVLHDSDVELASTAVNMFSPLRPMLAARCDAPEFRKLMSSDKKYHVETKFDGERFQIHMRGNEFKYFSRNGFDFTSSFGKDYESGILTPLLRDVIDVKVKNFILDGEMMGWNPQTKEYGSKGMRYDVKKLNTGTVYKPVFIAFDMLYLNDEDISQRPLYDRQALMLSVLTPKEGALKVSQVFEVRSGQDIIKALNESVDKGEEGIVFKDPNSVYSPNTRNRGWWKMKLEYFKHTMHDLDVLIVGGYYGNSKRNKFRMTSFLVAVAVKEKSCPTKYLAFCKVTSGLNDFEHMSLESQLIRRWQQVPPGRPTGIERLGITWGREVPDVYIPPYQSIVLEIRGTELIKVGNGEYPTAYTLRFPRIQKIRDDKLYTDILTVDELLKLTAEGKPIQKLSKRHLEMDELLQPPKKKPYRPIEYVPPTLQVVVQMSEVLKGFEFYVLSASSDWPKPLVEKEIMENGGTVVQFERERTHCILFGDHHPKVDWYRGVKDIVSLAWLRQVIDQREYKPYSRVHVKYAGRKMKPTMANQDEYGDQYVIPTSPVVLKELVVKIPRLGQSILGMAKNITGMMRFPSFGVSCVQIVDVK